MPPTIGGIGIDPQGQTVTVSITPKAKVYVDSAGSALASFPQTISGRMSYFVSAAGPYAVSVLFDGVEIAGPTGSPVTVQIDQGQQEWIAPTIDQPAENPTVSGTFAPTLTTDPVAKSAGLLRSQAPAGVTRHEMVASFWNAVDQLRMGSLVTKKVAQTGQTINLTANALATQGGGVTHYSVVPAGAPNVNYIADQGWLSAVAGPVYDLTADPTRLTNLFSAFTLDTQTVTLTGAATAGHTLEVQGVTYVPYQGLGNVLPQIGGDTSHILWEVVYFDFNQCGFVTAAGTGGSASVSGALDVPITSKLPLGSTRIDSGYTNGETTEGTSTGMTSARDNGTFWHYRMRGRSTASGFTKPFIPGQQFYIAGAQSAAGRGRAQTSTPFQLWMPTAGVFVNPSLAGIFALVRCIDTTTTDTNVAFGRLYLFVATRDNTAATVNVATALAAPNACDVYRLPAFGTIAADPDFFEGIKTVQ